MRLEEMDRYDVFEKLKFIHDIQGLDLSFNGIVFKANSAYIVGDDVSCIVDTKFNNMKKYTLLAEFDGRVIEEEELDTPPNVESLKAIRFLKLKSMSSVFIDRRDIISSNVHSKIKVISHLRRTVFSFNSEHDDIMIVSKSGVIRDRYNIRVINKKNNNLNPRNILSFRINLLLLKRILEESFFDCDIINFKFGSKDEPVLITGNCNNMRITWILKQETF